MHLWTFQPLLERNSLSLVLHEEAPSAALARTIRVSLTAVHCPWSSAPLCQWGHARVFHRKDILHSATFRLHILRKKGSRHSARERMRKDLGTLATRELFFCVFSFFSIFMWLYMFISSLKVGPCLCCLTIFPSADAWIPFQGKCLPWNPVWCSREVCAMTWELWEPYRASKSLRLTLSF